MAIDNNPAECALRPIGIGRKNWLFSQRQSGAKASANIYSFIETAKANGVNLYDYFKVVPTQLPNANTVEGSNSFYLGNSRRGLVSRSPLYAHPDNRRKGININNICFFMFVPCSSYR